MWCEYSVWLFAVKKCVLVWLEVYFAPIASELTLNTTKRATISRVMVTSFMWCGSSIHLKQCNNINWTYIIGSDVIYIQYVYIYIYIIHVCVCLCAFVFVCVRSCVHECVCLLEIIPFPSFPLSVIYFPGVVARVYVYRAFKCITFIHDSRDIISIFVL